MNQVEVEAEAGSLTRRSAVMKLRTKGGGGTKLPVALRHDELVKVDEREILHAEHVAVEAVV